MNRTLSTPPLPFNFQSSCLVSSPTMMVNPDAPPPLQPFESADHIAQYTPRQSSSGSPPHQFSLHDEPLHSSIPLAVPQQRQVYQVATGDNVAFENFPFISPPPLQPFGSVDHVPHRSPQQSDSERYDLSQAVMGSSIGSSSSQLQPSESPPHHLFPHDEVIHPSMTPAVPQQQQEYWQVLPPATASYSTPSPASEFNDAYPYTSPHRVSYALSGSHYPSSDSGPGLQVYTNDPPYPEYNVLGAGYVDNRLHRTSPGQADANVVFIDGQAMASYDTGDDSRLHHDCQLGAPSNYQEQYRYVQEHTLQYGFIDSRNYYWSPLPQNN